MKVKLYDLGYRPTLTRWQRFRGWWWTLWSEYVWLPLYMRRLEKRKKKNPERFPRP